MKLYNSDKPHLIGAILPSTATHSKSSMLYATTQNLFSRLNKIIDKLSFSTVNVDKFSSLRVGLGINKISFLPWLANWL